MSVAVLVILACDSIGSNPGVWPHYLAEDSPRVGKLAFQSPCAPTSHCRAAMTSCSLWQLHSGLSKMVEELSKSVAAGCIHSSFVHARKARKGWRRESSGISLCQRAPYCSLTNFKAVLPTQSRAKKISAEMSTCSTNYKEFTRDLHTHVWGKNRSFGL